LIFKTNEKKQTITNTKIITEVRMNSNPQMVIFFGLGNKSCNVSNETFSDASFVSIRFLLPVPPAIFLRGIPFVVCL
jgi:hypothetical protein